MINKRKKVGNFKKRKCELCEQKVNYVDYKDIKYLEKFINNTGQIKPSSATGTCAKAQRKIANAIKRARYMALIPFVRERIRSNK